MTLTLITLLLTTFLCLAFASTRIVGVIALFVLMNLDPVPVLALLAIGGGVFLLYHFYLRS